MTSRFAEGSRKSHAATTRILGPRGPRLPPGPDPTTYWKTFPEPDFDDVRRAKVREPLRNDAPLRSPQWRAAVGGDAAAAIGLALELLSDDAEHPELDMAMTAVLACALEGDPAAALVISHAVRSVSDGAHSARIGTSWLVGNLARAAARVPRDGSRR